MVRTTLASLLGLACLMAATGAQAQVGVYGGAFVSRITLSEDDPDFDDVSPTAIGVKLGMSISKNFAVEGRLGTGLSDDSANGADFKIDRLIGIYGKGILPVADKASLYGLIGYTSVKATTEFLGFSFSDKEDDFSYGVGGDFALTPTLSLNVEWARLLTGDNFKTDGVTLGLSFKF